MDNNESTRKKQGTARPLPHDRDTQSDREEKEQAWKAKCHLQSCLGERRDGLIYLLSHGYRITLVYPGHDAVL